MEDEVGAGRRRVTRGNKESAISLLVDNFRLRFVDTPIEDISGSRFAPQLCSRRLGSKAQYSSYRSLPQVEEIDTLVRLANVAEAAGWY
jgi:hypothetical protein